MDRKTIESAVIVFLFAAMFVLGHFLNMRKFNRRYGQGTPSVITSSRLPFRFGLKTLLIALTLAAIGAALVMAAFR